MGELITQVLFHMHVRVHTHCDRVRTIGYTLTMFVARQLILVHDLFDQKRSLTKTNFYYRLVHDAEKRVGCRIMNYTLVHILLLIYLH